MKNAPRFFRLKGILRPTMDGFFLPQIMSRTSSAIRDYLWRRRRPRQATNADEENVSLIVTGEELVDRIIEAIRLRRPVLITGPRGCGKTYCANKAIAAAEAEHSIAGYSFLQGNREIPRDYLSEDMLVIGDNGQPERLEALALRPTGRGLQNPNSQTRTRSAEFPHWPALPAAEWKNQERPWTDLDWKVLFLDEVNRFSEGFLDSLLSLTEEGTIVRRGEEFCVPIVLVATANPPGYDITAKRLSPPLQARIARSYRVSQPPLEHLVHLMIAAKRKHSVYDGICAIDQGLEYLAAGVTLCLWGDPDAGSKGQNFLTEGTKRLLRSAMSRDATLADEMKELSTLVTFGPDARAASEWLACAMGLAFAERATTKEAQQQDMVPVTEEHLLRTAVEVLSHKIREDFNEGAEPGKMLELQKRLRAIAECGLKRPSLRELFILPYYQAVNRLALWPDLESRERHFQLFKALDLIPEPRRHSWIRALADLPREGEASVTLLLDWSRRHSGRDTSESVLTEERRCVSHTEFSWLLELISRSARSDSKQLEELLDQNLACDLAAVLHSTLVGWSNIAGLEMELLAVVRKHWSLFDHRHDHAVLHRWVTLLGRIGDPLAGSYDDEGQAPNGVSGEKFIKRSVASAEDSMRELTASFLKEPVRNFAIQRALAEGLRCVARFGTRGQQMRAIAAMAQLRL